VVAACGNRGMAVVAVCASSSRDIVEVVAACGTLGRDIVEVVAACGTLGRDIVEVVAACGTLGRDIVEVVATFFCTLDSGTAVVAAGVDVDAGVAVVVGSDGLGAC